MVARRDSRPPTAVSLRLRIAPIPHMSDLAHRWRTARAVYPGMFTKR
jgi:hypothetical protein